MDVSNFNQDKLKILMQEIGQEKSSGIFTVVFLTIGERVRGRITYSVNRVIQKI